ALSVGAGGSAHQGAVTARAAGTTGRRAWRQGLARTGRRAARPARAPADDARRHHVGVRSAAAWGGTTPSPGGGLRGRVVARRSGGGLRRGWRLRRVGGAGGASGSEPGEISRSYAA